jgi:hypothetical protein
VRESTLLAWFTGAATIAELRDDLVDVVHRSDLHTGGNLVLDLRESVVVRAPHLVALCDAFLAGDLEPQHLSGAAFFLLASEHFNWDTESPDGDLVSRVLFDWSAPQLHLALDRQNVARYRDALSRGRHPSDA